MHKLKLERFINEIRILIFEEYHKDKLNSGILMIIIATFCFSLMAIIVKYLNHLPLMEILFFRSMPTVLIIPLILEKKICFWGNNKKLLLLRSLFSGIAVGTYFYTIKVMALPDAVTIRGLSPFLTIILSGIFLGERIGHRKIYFIIFAFLGALLVVKPGIRLDLYPAIIGLVGVIFAAWSHLMLRVLRLTENPLVVVNYFGHTSGLISLVILLWNGNFIIPNALSLLTLFLLGLTGLGGHFALVKAFQMAPANVISLYLYSQIIFTTFLGVLFFKEIPDIFSVIGASIIIASGYLNFNSLSKNNKNISKN